MAELSNVPELLLDDLWVLRPRNLRRRLCRPEKHPANPLIVRRHPWEAHMIQAYGNVLFDQGRFRFWYFAAEQRDPADVPWVVARRDRPARLYSICYAESEDGLDWRRPLSATVPFPPYGEHNVLVRDMHSICVLRDDEASDPSRRYKGLGGDRTVVSADGFDWDVRANPAVGKNDTGSSVVRWRGDYLAYVRQQTTAPEWPVVRAVGLSTSRDFDAWTPKETVLTTDAQDGHPFTQPYGLTVVPQGDILVGILWTIRLDRVAAGAGVSWRWNNRVGDIRTELVCSRDGRAWRRVADRAEWLAPTPGAWDGARVWPATSVLVHDGRIRVYYTGSTARHGVPGGEPGIGLATLPEDRWVALTAADAGEPATFDTPALARPGAGDLVLNADPAGGAIRVAVRTAAGEPTAGFGADACGLTPVDGRRWRVRWGERGLASAPAPAVLRIELTGDARLHALQAA